MTTIEKGVVFEEAPPLDTLTQHQNNAKKVPPPITDTIETHPLAYQRAQVNFRDCQASVQATEERSRKEKYVDGVYNVATWAWGLIFPKSKENNVEEVSAERQEHAKELALFVDEMRRLLTRIKDMSEEEFHDVSFETILNDMYKAGVEDKEALARLDREKFTEVFKEKQALNKERLEELDRIIRDGRSSRMWGLFEKTTTAVGVAAAAIGVSTGWGAIAFCFGCGLVADQMFDDTAKKKIASWMGGTQESEDQWLNTLRLGAGVASIALFLGLTGSKAFEALLNIPKGSATIGKAVTDHRANKDQATLNEVSNKVTKCEERLKKENASIKKIVGDVYDYYTNMSRIAQSQQEAFTFITRS